MGRGTLQEERVPARPARSKRLPIVMVAAGAACLLVVGVLQLTGGGDAGSTAPGRAPAVAQAPVGADRNSLSGAIVVAQERLRRLPRDDVTWAQLGSAYVQQGRVTVDPSFYPKAQGALERSLVLSPTGNEAAFIGLGSLANARHEFAQAAGWARKAIAVDAYSADAQGVLNDALTQLGDYPGAQKAAQRMVDLRPGLSSFTRASYVFEQKGDVAAARGALSRALAESTDPADVAFCRYYLGELAFNGGDPKAALQQYRLGLVVQPESDQLIAGRAKSEAALGDSDAAVKDYATVVGRVPLPEYVLEYGQVLQSLGRVAEAEQQYALFGSEQQLFAANGVVDDLSAAVFEADHGSASVAVSHARAEWARRKSVLVADALAWALHKDGQDVEALTYAKRADRLGWRNATFAYHRGMIEQGLGDRGAARKSLARALEINPYFSPLEAPKARAALASLKADG